eukprot:3152261-Rhodomonas_salina.4
MLRSTTRKALETGWDGAERGDCWPLGHAEAKLTLQMGCRVQDVRATYTDSVQIISSFRPGPTPETLARFAGLVADGCFRSALAEPRASHACCTPPPPPPANAWLLSALRLCGSQSTCGAEELSWVRVCAARDDLGVIYAARDGVAMGIGDANTMVCPRTNATEARKVAMTA